MINCAVVMCTEALTTAWTKFYCQYQKESRTLTMVAYNQTVGKGASGVSLSKASAFSSRI